MEQVYKTWICFEDDTEIDGVIRKFDDRSIILSTVCELNGNSIKGCITRYKEYWILFNVQRISSNELYWSNKLNISYDFELHEVEQLEKLFLYKYTCQYAFTYYHPECDIKPLDIKPTLKSAFLNFRYLKDWLYSPEMLTTTYNSIKINKIERRILTQNYCIELLLMNNMLSYPADIAIDINIKFFSTVKITFEKEVLFEDCINEIEKLKDFLTFCFDKYSDYNINGGDNSEYSFNIYKKTNYNENLEDEHLNYSPPNATIRFISDEKLQKAYNTFLDKWDRNRSIFNIYSSFVLHTKNIPEVTFLSCMRCIEKIIDNYIFDKKEVERIMSEEQPNATWGGVIVDSLRKIQNSHKRDWSKVLRTKIYYLCYLSSSKNKYSYFLNLIIMCFNPFMRMEIFDSLLTTEMNVLIPPKIKFHKL